MGNGSGKFSLLVFLFIFCLPLSFSLSIPLAETNYTGLSLWCRLRFRVLKPMDVYKDSRQRMWTWRNEITIVWPTWDHHWWVMWQNQSQLSHPKPGKVCNVTIFIYLCQVWPTATNLKNFHITNVLSRFQHRYKHNLQDARFGRI